MTRLTWTANALLTVLCLVMLPGCKAEWADGHQAVAAQGAYHGSLSADGRHLVIGSIHHGGSLWRTAPLARQFEWNHAADAKTEILFTEFSADGRYALTADYYTLTLWEVESGESVWYWEAPARIEAVDLSADGRFALLGLHSGRAVLFDAVNGGIIRDLHHDSPVLSVALDNNATRALTGTEAHTAHLWHIPNNELIRRFDLPNQVTLVALSGDATIALLGPARDKAELWHLDQRSKIADLPVGKHRLFRARFSDDQLLLGTTHKQILQFDIQSARRTGHWQIGRFWQLASRSTTVLDMVWRDNQLWALGSDGYVYQFQ